MVLRVDIVDAIYAKEEEAVQQHRPHLGASQIGRPCEREVYLSFRWAKAPSFNGRMLRLFQRGQDEEARLVDALEKAGMIVSDSEPRTGEQYRAEVFPHFSGSLDGIGKLDNEEYLLEFKTHSSKSFKKLEKSGVQVAKPEHFTQMQVYMGCYNLEKALYVSVNKDNDELYIEEIDYSQDVFEATKRKAERLVFGYGAPSVNYSLESKTSPCRFCDYKGICHEGDTPEKNCRTCAYAEPTKEGEWFCQKHKIDLPLYKQRKGCDYYEVFSI